MGIVCGFEKLAGIAGSWKKAGLKVVFTNGCFDLLHAGHVRYLEAARLLGDRLAVGLNSDRSVKGLKGDGRPLTPELERAELLASLECVDTVTIFDQPTPISLITGIRPDILVKGGDWPLDSIVGRPEVLSWGGRVLTIPAISGRSTSGMIARIRGGERI